MPTPMMDKFLSKFGGGAPLVPQILIGLAVMLFRPLAILTSKKDDSSIKVPAAARVFTTELVAFPIAIGVALAGGAVGKRLCLKDNNKDIIATISQTLGFIVANAVIPPIATYVLHKYPIEKKMENAFSTKPRTSIKKPEVSNNLTSPPTFKGSLKGAPLQVNYTSNKSYSSGLRV